ncbi:GPO family capsid scaffolding protein [Delftia sp. NA_296.1]|uniref:GPO family capsid scaffolding protein n=1 Tax=Delftia sp. NA_296.1 TaxID=3415648 RepID=UPI004045B96D
MPTKSKWFRVATEGATTDGREITRAEIQQMAASYDREKTYGARVWLEHYRGTVPGGPFDALGDVLALKAEENEDKKLQLFAQIEPLQGLIEMNKKGQKIFSSIEIHPSFPKTGGAYFFGLAVTDSPASLSTEVLKFSAGDLAKSPFVGRKVDQALMFSVAEPAELVFEETPAATSGETGAVQAVVSAFTKVLERLMPQPEKKPEPVQAHSVDKDKVLEAFTGIGQVLETMAKKQDAVASQFAQLQTQHTDLVKKLSQEEQPGQQRQPATGGNGQTMADY